MPVFTTSFSGCPILAAFAKVGMFERSTFTFPIVAKSKPPPFEDHKGWGIPATRKGPISSSALTYRRGII